MGEGSVLEIWRLTLWAARGRAFIDASRAYQRAGHPALAKAAWFIANVLAQRGPLYDPNDLENELRAHRGQRRRKRK